MPSVFFPKSLVEPARRAGDPSRAAATARMVAAAQPWRDMDDEALWNLMFGPSIKRSWMVWSDGYCPACRRGVPMYNWLSNPLTDPWKMRCPHCAARFPTNDFGAFWRSGLDDRHCFDPSKADRSLLFHSEHPDPSDPLHRFGVDDGDGAIADGHRWRFIGAYLIYGQWKQGIVQGVERLAAAHVATGDPVSARKAALLLDRIADLYPEHDFGKQGVMYEGPPRAGYVSTWHDACLETRSLAIAWDMVRDAASVDPDLVGFLRRQSERWRVSRPKRTFADIAENIAEGLLRHPRRNPERIHCNYPQTELTIGILETVERGTLDGAEAQFDPILPKMTAVDGLTGEKGLTGYSTFATQQLANVIALHTRARPDFLQRLLARHPGLAKTYRFHLDTWCDRTFQPRIGDSGAVGFPHKPYPAVVFSEDPGILPAIAPFLIQLSERTGDPGYVQAAWHAAGEDPRRVTPDFFAADPRADGRTVARWIRKHGAVPRQRSVLFQEWHLALLRPKDGAARDTLWIDFDSGGYHSHADGMNIGLFAHGLDLLPDFGYPPVQFGGWESEMARWYLHTAAHNTVVVDGRRQTNGAGPVTERAGYEGLPAGRAMIWAIADNVECIRVDGNGFYPDTTRYERTLVKVRTGRDTFAVVDCFRVAGGTDHARMCHGPIGAFETHGLRLGGSEPLGSGTLLSDFRTDPAPAPGWSVHWTPDDVHGTRTPGNPVVLRCTDFTDGARASTCRAWVAPEGITKPTEGSVPSLMVRRSGPAPLASTFVAVLDVHRGTPGSSGIRRHATGNASDALISWSEPGGSETVVWIRDGGKSRSRVALPRGGTLETGAEVTVVRFPRSGSPSVLLPAGGDASARYVRSSPPEPAS
ncbi:MAG: heparinase II/III family protein [Armatimonadota bacterium]